MFKYIFSFLIIVLLIVIYFYLKTVYDSLKFNFKIEKIDDILLKNINYNSLNNGTSFIELKIALFIYFSGLFNIKIKELYVEAYYNNSLVAKSANNEDNKKLITLEKNINNKFYQTFQVYLNKNTLDLVLAIKQNKSYKIDYRLSFKLFNIKLNYSGKYENN